MEGRIYNINKRLHHYTRLLIRHLFDAAEFIGFIHYGKKKGFVLSPDNGVNLEMIRLALLVYNIRPFLQCQHGSLSLLYRRCSFLFCRVWHYGKDTSLV
ncbi:hypothetical protein, partial [Candidatus Enterovibrio escicola]